LIGIFKSSTKANRGTLRSNEAFKSGNKACEIFLKAFNLLVCSKAKQRIFWQVKASKSLLSHPCSLILGDILSNLK
jgi:hypothetical protein